jgi:hypothetical protein
LPAIDLAVNPRILIAAEAAPTGLAVAGAETDPTNNQQPTTNNQQPTTGAASVLDSVHGSS